MRLKEFVTKSLQSLGLTEGETQVYLILMKKPLLTASELQFETKLSSAGIYKIVDSLMHLELIEMTQKRKPFRFQTTGLDALSSKLSKQGRKWQRMFQYMNLLSRSDECLSETMEVIPSEDSAFEEFYMQILSKKPDFLAFMGTFDAILSLTGKEVEEAFIRERVKRGIRADGIMFRKDELSQKLEKRNWREKREFQYFPIINYPREFTYVYGDHVSSFFEGPDGKPQIFHCESRPMARARLMQINAMWNSTQR